MTKYVSMFILVFGLACISRHAIALPVQQYCTVVHDPRFHTPLMLCTTPGDAIFQQILQHNKAQDAQEEFDKEMDEDAQRIRDAMARDVAPITSLEEILDFVAGLKPTPSDRSPSTDANEIAPTEIVNEIKKEEKARAEFAREMHDVGQAIDSQFTDADKVKLIPVPERVRRLIHS